MDKLYKNIVKLKNDYVTLKKLDNNYKITHVGGTGLEDVIKDLFDLFIYTNLRADVNYKMSNYSYYRVRNTFLELKQKPVFMSFINNSAKNSTVIIDSLNFAGWTGAKREINHLIDKASHSIIYSLKDIILKKNIIKNLWGLENIPERIEDLEPQKNSAIYELRKYLYKDVSVARTYDEKKEITNNERMMYTINFFRLISIINKGETNFVIVHRSDEFQDNFIKLEENYKNVYLLNLYIKKKIIYPNEIIRSYPTEIRQDGLRDININEIDDIACVILLYIICNKHGNKNVSIMTRDDYSWSTKYPNIQLYFQKLNVHGLLDERKLHKLNLPGIIKLEYKYIYKSFHNIITSNKTLITINYTKAPDAILDIEHSARQGYRRQMFRFLRI